LRGTRAHDRLLVTQRTDAARAWTRAESSAGTLALVDHELDAHDPLVGELRALGIQVDVLPECLSALLRMGARRPDVVVLSTSITGLELPAVVEAVRAELSIPVLLAFHAREIGSIGPTVAAGALPAVERPYRLGGLLAAIQPYWPRHRRQCEPLTVGHLELDVSGYEARFGRVRLDLTPMEFNVLVGLARGADRVVLRDDLARRLWPASADAVGALVATVTKLRRKLVDVGAPDAIRTVRGLGYRLESAGLTTAEAAAPTARGTDGHG
jgi:DNA-binding response OmpR family regulator